MSIYRAVKIVLTILCCASIRWKARTSALKPKSFGELRLFLSMPNTFFRTNSIHYRARTARFASRSSLLFHSRGREDRYPQQSALARPPSATRSAAHPFGVLLARAHLALQQERSSASPNAESVRHSYNTESAWLASLWPSAERNVARSFPAFRFSERRACTSLNGFGITEYEIRLVVCWGGLSAHSYNTLLTGGLLVAVGGRANSPLWGRDQAVRLIKQSWHEKKQAQRSCTCYLSLRGARNATRI